MWQDKLKEVIYILENSNVNEIDVTFWGRRFRVVKSAGVNINSDSKLNQTSSVVSNEKPIPSQSKISEDTKKDNSEEILSPMPGTFYSSPSPEAAPFIKEGDVVSKGDSLCIIEAMKIMNEIESEKSGTIKKLLVDDGSAVDYNQPLFLIDPS
ncbi:MAG: acetyl-CoA carboxylase biotin carboxyl carrier protein [Candidatus Marinimicrobia bacterium]|jgi:acetyl-CoA carboxylase biotin carboxyl carrier protein|nr:acetyl-CoA carboxylase biotin carboxyl carrier protein [Candidatus Neomarinimicrobiota bacterium]|tara:strand:- start:86 stop:544 length:459 start_codon:yes stop_codon:yes gene_type:complete